MKILIVEDEAIAALALRLAVERMGHEVVADVDSGEAAVASAERHRPDLVLMDTRLRGTLNGVEAANTIWAEQGIRSVFISAHDARTLEAEYSGGEPFLALVKPVMDEDLADLLRRIDVLE
jgi:CheY-like chemotaxis protein